MKSGYVTLIGLPNVGKSTIFNLVLNQKLSIISPKPQTTIQRINGFINKRDEYQIILSDIPGLISPQSKYYQQFQSIINDAVADTDIFIVVIDSTANFEQQWQEIFTILKTDKPILVIFNKKDKIKQNQQDLIKEQFLKKETDYKYKFLAATQTKSFQELIQIIRKMLPEHPPYFNQDDDVSDSPTRFFVAELIREKIYLNYQQEIPYSCCVEVIEYKIKSQITYIKAHIFTEKESQKKILIGYKGEKLKELGRQARLEIENFIKQKIYLDIEIRLKKDAIRNKITNFAKIL